MNNRLIAALSSGACIVAMAAPAAAQAQTRDYDIPAGSLRSALGAYVRQSGRQVIYRGGEMKGVQSRGVRGAMTQQGALDAILAGTGFGTRNGASGAVAIYRLGEPEAGARSAAQGSETASSAEYGNESTIGLVEGGSATSEILVVGQRSLNADIRRSENDSQPYVVINRKEIERSTATDVQQLLLQKLSMATREFTLNQFVTTLNRTSISLRGLTERETLILIDGRRVATPVVGGATTQANLSGIPLAAIERVEVLPSGSAGQYGGGATAGVINIILRRDYRGVDVSAQYEGTFDGGGETRRMNFAAGGNFSGGRTSVSLTGSWVRTSDLLMQDRGLYGRGIARILANNPSAILGLTSPPLGTTTNIRSVSGGNLTLKAAFGGGALTSPFTSVPLGYAGPGSDNGAGLIANAGRYNLGLANSAQSGAGGRRSLLAASSTWSARATVRHDFSPWVTGFVELGGGQTDSGFNNSSASSTFVLTAASSANPFAQDVRVIVPGTGADFRNPTQMTEYKALAGLIARAGSWRIAGDYTYSVNEWSGNSTLGIDTAPAGAAVSSGTINVFRDVNTFPIDFTPYRTPEYTISPIKSKAHAAAIRASGPIGMFMLPGGAPTATIVGEWRREGFGNLITTYPSFSLVSVTYPRQQRALAAYGEAIFPVFSEPNRVPGIRLLELRVAARIEQYRQRGSGTASGATLLPDTGSGFDHKFSSIDPTVSMRWKPIDDVMLRASYGTGFQPPELGQLNPSAPATVVVTSVRDPARGNEPVSNIIQSGELNTQVRPEQSKSWSAGVVLTPSFIPRLRLSVDWTQIHKTDAITLVAPAFSQQDLDTLLTYFAERVTRNPDPASFGAFSVGPITRLRTGFLNLSAANFEAVDFNLDYNLPTSIGEFTLYANATRALVNETQARTAAPFVDNLGTRAQLTWRGNGGISWDHGPLTVSWTSRYFDHYFVNASRAFVASQASAKVASQIYHDLNIRYRFGTGGAAILSGAELTVGVRNLFNKRPPFDSVQSAQAYYSQFGDPRGAIYQINIRRTF